MKDINILAVQPDIAWEDPAANFRQIEELIGGKTGGVGLIVLPEFFAVGFTPLMASLAEQSDGPSLAWMKGLAHDTGAIVAGTVPTVVDNGVVNRFWWISPDGGTVFYDKFHLFGVGGETKRLVPGSQRPVISALGWKWMPQVCYDLRFPVFARNGYDQGSFAYDVLVYAANWPASRSHHWLTLLTARAIENMCYVVGVNRTGTDGTGLVHQGDTIVIDPKGNVVAVAGTNSPQVVAATLHAGELKAWREKFMIAPDWDNAPLPARTPISLL